MTAEATRPHESPTINWNAIELLRSWREGTEEEAREQRETLDYLIKALDEDRDAIGARRLFEDHARPA